MRFLNLLILVFLFNLFFTANAFAGDWKQVQRGSVTYIKQSRDDVLCEIIFRSNDHLIAGAISMNKNDEFKKFKKGQPSEIEWIEIWENNLGLVETVRTSVVEEGYNIKGVSSDKMFEDYCKDPKGLPEELLGMSITQELFL